MAKDPTSPDQWRNSTPLPPPVGPEVARQMRFSSAEYDRARGWYQVIWERHVRSGKDGPAGPPSAADRDGVLLPSSAEAEDLLVRGAEDQLDPCLGRAQRQLVAAEGTVEELERWTVRDVRAGGQTWTWSEADARARRLSTQIDHDTAVGWRHHQRVSVRLRRIATALLLLDIAAIITIFVDLFNVDFGNLRGSVKELLAAVFLPVIVLTVQVLAADATGRRWNEYRELRITVNDQAVQARKRLRLPALVLAAVVLGLTGLLLFRLYSISVDAGLGVGWRLVLCLLGLVVGIGAPLVKVYVVAEDGSTASRLRDELETALEREREIAKATVAHAQDGLDAVKIAHEDYLARLRPRVLYEAGAPLVEAENTLGLLAVMLDSAPPNGTAAWQPRRPPKPESAGPAAAAAAPVDFPLLRWSSDCGLEINNEPLIRRDRSYTEQRTEEQRLRLRLAAAVTPTRQPAPTAPAALPTAVPRPAGELTGSVVEDTEDRTPRDSGN